MNMYTAEELTAARAGCVHDDVALWRGAMRRACRADWPHYREYVDPRTGRVLATLPPCTHPAPSQEG